MKNLCVAYITSCHSMDWLYMDIAEDAISTFNSKILSRRVIESRE